MWHVQNQNELYHHGIKGQKWYVRRFQNPDGTLTEAGKRRYRKGSEERSYERNNEKRTLSDKQKKAIKIGAAAGAVALVAVGGYALYKSGKMGDLVNGGKNALGKVKTKWDSYKGPIASLRDEAASLSNDDLIKRNTRMNLESKYVQNRLRQLEKPNESRFDGVLAGLTSAGAAIASVQAIRDMLSRKRNGEEKSGSNVSEMSDQELRDLINRANLENQYRNIYEKQRETATEKSRGDKAKELIDVGIRTASAGKSIESAIDETRRRRKLRE